MSHRSRIRGPSAVAGAEFGIGNLSGSSIIGIGLPGFNSFSIFTGILQEGGFAIDGASL